VIDPNFQKVLDNSGLTKIELAQLYDVSRQTIHYWSTIGPAREGSLTARMATVVTKALQQAIAKKLLPLPPLDTRVRQQRVASMVKQVQNLKPAPK